MATLLVRVFVPPMPSTCSGWGEPITLSSTASRLSVSAGRSEAMKYGPRDVPPRMITQGILRCKVSSGRFSYLYRPRLTSQSWITPATTSLFLSIMIMCELPLIPILGRSTMSALPPAARKAS